MSIRQPDGTTNVDVALSYRHHDKGLCDFVEGELKRLGLKVFRDISDMTAGDTYTKQWRDAVEQEYAPVVVVLVTARTVEPKEDGNNFIVQKEVSYALQVRQRQLEERRDKTVRVVPVLTEDRLWIPFLRSFEQEPGRRVPMEENVWIKLPSGWEEDACADSARAEFRGKLWRTTLGRQFRQDTDKALRCARGWALETTNTFLTDFDFSGQRDGYLDDLSGDGHFQHMALVGPGGRGKSVVLARRIKAVASADNPRVYPILVEPSALAEQGLAAAALALSPAFETILGSSRQAIGETGGRGSSTALDAAQKGIFAECLNKGHELLKAPICFVVDGLERAPIEIRDKKDVVVEALHTLAGIARVVVTCRLDEWNSRFNGLSEFKLVELPVLRAHTLCEALGVRSVDSLSSDVLPMLQEPAILDIAAKLRTVTGPAGLTDSDLAEAFDASRLFNKLRLWATGAMTIGRSIGATPENLKRAAKSFLESLSKIQLGTLEFWVSEANVLSDLTDKATTSQALHQLKANQKYLLSVRRGGIRLVRRRHDLVDAFECARLMIDDPDAEELRQQVYAGAQKPVASYLFNQLADLASKRGHQGTLILDEMFRQFLLMLDRKALGTIAMAQAWAATFALEDRFTLYRSRIIKCLSGRVVPSLKPGASKKGKVTRLGAANRVSSVSPPQVTQEAASSLAATFRAQQTFVEDSEQTLNALLEKIHPDRFGVPESQRLRYRGRLIEALPRIGHPKVLAEIKGLLNDPGYLSKDFDVALYIVNALALLTGDEVDAILKRIAEEAGALKLLSNCRPPAWKVTQIQRRAALACDDRVVTQGLAQRIPFTSEELCNGLSICNEFGAPSDWEEIVRYVGYAARWLKANPQDSKTLSALIGALDHAHTHAQAIVASHLDAIDAPAVRAVLIAKLTDPAVAGQLFNCIEKSLRAHLTAEPAERHRRRLVYLTVAHRIERLRGSSGGATTALREMAAARLLQGSDGALADERAAELYPPSSVIADEEPRVRRVGKLSRDPAAMSAIRDSEGIDVGSAIEKKYRVVEARRDEDGILAFEVATADWQIDAAFHEVMQIERSYGYARFADRLERILQSGRSDLPGLMSVHTIALTSDRRILFGLRASWKRYSPGTWAASFEEQITASDFEAAGCPIANCARRGFAEEYLFIPHMAPFRELPKEVRNAPVHVVSALIETQILNISPVAIIGVPYTAEHIWNTWKKNKEEFKAIRDQEPEIAEVEAVPLDKLPSSPAEAHELTWAKRHDNAMLHPTTRLRMAVLSRTTSYGKIL